MSDFRSIASLRNRIDKEAERKRIEDEEARQSFIEEQTLFSTRPHRPGFEKPEMFQEGLFDVFKPKPSETQKSSSSPKTIEDVETMHDIVIDKDFKKFMTENPNGGKFKYPNNKIVSKEILEFIDGEGDPSICSLNQFINANCEYDGCIEICDYCLYIGGWIDDKGLYLATNKSSCASTGSIIFSDVIENGYDYNDRIFAKSFKDLLKNATFGKAVKEYSEMDLDDMSDYIQEGLFDKFKRHIYESIDEMEEMNDIKLDKSFKDYYKQKPSGLSFTYDSNDCVDKYSKDHVEDMINATWHMMSYEELMKENSEYIELNDYCVSFAVANVGEDCLWIATNKSKHYEPGSILITNTIDEIDPWYNTGLFAKSFKELIKNAGIKSEKVKESFEDLDEMSEEEYQMFVEAKISAAERNELEDDDFGLVYEDEDGKKIRKYPLTDKQHVLQAVRFFGDCPDEYKPLLAHNILKRAKKFDMDDSNWDKIHEWNEKYSEDEDNEKS